MITNTTIDVIKWLWQKLKNICNIKLACINVTPTTYYVVGDFCAKEIVKRIYS